VRVIATDFDINLSDITFEQDFTKALEQDLTKLNHAQAFLWLGIKFVSKGIDRVTSQELANEVWGGKDSSYCLKILKRFVSLRLLKTEDKDNLRIRYFRLQASKEIFIKYKDLAMNTIKRGGE
jgi:hypothetical protein